MNYHPIKTKKGNCQLVPPQPAVKVPVHIWSHGGGWGRWEEEPAMKELLLKSWA